MRNITKVHVYGRDEANRKSFADEMSRECAVEVIPVAKPEEAAKNLDIIATITSSREPVLHGEWVSPGQHLNIAGSNFITKSEIDVEVVRRSNIVAIDSKEQGRIEAGDLVEAIDQNVVEWIDITEIGRIVAGQGTRPILCSRRYALQVAWHWSGRHCCRRQGLHQSQGNGAG